MMLVYGTIVILFQSLSSKTRNFNFIFQCEEIDQFALTLERNSKIAVGEFIFYYIINSRANLKRKLTQIW